VKALKKCRGDARIDPKVWADVGALSEDKKYSRSASAPIILFSFLRPRGNLQYLKLSRF